jgi:hypothetical protein
LVKQPTHFPLVESHTGALLFLMRHSLSADLHATHWLAAQTGLVGSAAQSLLCTQATHRPLVVSQTPTLTLPLLRPEHWLLAVHAPHRLLRQTGFVGSAVQSLLCTQATQRPVVVSQTPALTPPSARPEHWLLVVHVTH